MVIIPLPTNIMSDRTGRSFGSTGAARSAVESHSDPQGSSRRGLRTNWLTEQVRVGMRAERLAIICFRARLLRLQAPAAPPPPDLLDWSDFNFDSHFNDLRYRNAKICGRWFDVALHECVQALPPHPHARNALGWNNRFPTDVIRDFRQISKPRLLVRKAHALRNRRTVHEAVIQNAQIEMHYPPFFRDSSQPSAASESRQISDS